MLDFNRNGTIDPASEGLYLTNDLIQHAFSGVHDIDNIYYVDASKISVNFEPVIPEPASLIILGLGAGMALYRRPKHD